MNKSKIECRKCHATADLKDSPNAWDGWQVVPEEECPKCIASALAMRDVLVREDVFCGKVIRTFHIVGELS